METEKVPISELGVVPEDAKIICNTLYAPDENTTFTDLAKLDVSGRVKQKNGLNYLSWADAYEEMKKYDPNAEVYICRQIPDEFGNSRWWFDDGKTAWVEMEVTIKGQTIHSFPFPIMDFKNKALPAESVTTTDANKSIMRCFVKTLAQFGLGLYLYQGEDLPEATRETNTLKDEVAKLGMEKTKLGPEGKEKVEALMNAAKKEAFPEMGDDAVNISIMEIDDDEILEKLKKQLRAIRIRAKKQG